MFENTDLQQFAAVTWDNMLFAESSYITRNQISLNYNMLPYKEVPYFSFYGILVTVSWVPQFRCHCVASDISITLPIAIVLF